MIVKLASSITGDNIRQGIGDTVCYILNDLLNRELIRKNFKFEQSKIIAEIEDNNCELDNPDTTDMEFKTNVRNRMNDEQEGQEQLNFEAKLDNVLK